MCLKGCRPLGVLQRAYTSTLISQGRLPALTLKRDLLERSMISAAHSPLELTPGCPLLFCFSGIIRVQLQSFLSRVTACSWGTGCISNNGLLMDREMSFLDTRRPFLNLVQVPVKWLLGCFSILYADTFPFETGSPSEVASCVTVLHISQ